jgi:hypothetical protein
MKYFFFAYTFSKNNEIGTSNDLSTSSIGIFDIRGIENIVKKAKAYDVVVITNFAEISKETHEYNATK